MQSLITSMPLKSTSLLRNLFVAAGLSAAAIGTAPAYAQDAAVQDAGAALVGSITMDGRGAVSVAPDMAVISTSVVTTSKTAAQALEENTAAITRVIDAIKAEGIEARDIQTSGFGISPRYDHNSSRADGQPSIVGYEVRNGVDVNIRDLTKLGALLTLVVDNGANSVGGIRFEVSDPQDKLDEARTNAVKAARHKAEVFAAAAGVELGDILTITETGFQMPQPVMMRAESMMMSKAPVPIEAGEESITASVTIRWALK